MNKQHASGALVPEDYPEFLRGLKQRIQQAQLRAVPSVNRELVLLAFAEAWPAESIVQQVVGRLPWGHNVRLIDLVKNPAERLW